MAKGMKVIQQGAVKKSYGAGPTGPTTMPKGPGKAAQAKMGINSKRMVEDKYCK